MKAQGHTDTVTHITPLLHTHTQECITKTGCHYRTITAGDRAQPRCISNYMKLEFLSVDSHRQHSEGLLPRAGVGVRTAKPKFSKNWRYKFSSLLDSTMAFIAALIYFS